MVKKALIIVNELRAISEEYNALVATPMGARYGRTAGGIISMTGGKGLGSGPCLCQQADFNDRLGAGLLISAADNICECLQIAAWCDRSVQRIYTTTRATRRAGGKKPLFNARTFETPADVFRTMLSQDTLDKVKDNKMHGTVWLCDRYTGKSSASQKEKEKKTQIADDLPVHSCRSQDHILTSPYLRDLYCPVGVA
jgi:hypothetical protein